MASKQPVHGGSAQTKEFDVDLVAEGVRGPSDSHHALAVVSVDANATLRVEISAANESDWQLDALRVVDSRSHPRAHLPRGRVRRRGRRPREQGPIYE